VSPHPLDALFAPRSVVVLGVSRNPAKLGFKLLQNVTSRGYGGAIHVVNPAGEAILGCPTVSTIDALPTGIDLALVSLPAPAVTEAIAGLAARGVRMAVILSSGFGEVDVEGGRVQGGLLAAARRAGLRLVGPNCMGVYSAPARLNGTYFWDLPQVMGRIGVVSQSGAYGGLIFRHLGGRGLGVSRFLSIGNQSDIDAAEVVEYLAGDGETALIACFIEALRDGRRFVEVAARACLAKPVVVLKGGRSEAGRRAAGSHTGSLAGAFDVYRAAFDRAGVVLAEETEELFDAIEALVTAGPTRPAKPEVAIVTVSGGPSVVAADAAERAGLRVPPLDDAARAALRELLPSFAAVGNPVDLTPQVDPSRIGAAVSLVLRQPSVAGGIAVDVGLDIPEFADGLVAAARATGKPLVAFIADAPGLTARLVAAGVPTLPSPERAVRAWRALWMARPRPPLPRLSATRLPPDISTALAAIEGPVPPALARRALEAYGIRFCREAVAASDDDAVRAAEGIGFPVVVKASLPGLIHKTEVGGVRTDVRDAAGVREACAVLRERAGAEHFIVQEQVNPGVELLIGGSRDGTFGPVVAAGVGGIFAEVMRDVGLRLAPLDEGEARALLREGARGRLLAGPRGLPPCDEDPLVEMLLGVADLMVAESRVLEVDLNPVIAAGRRAVAVDVVLIAGSRS
jgi:acetate---CoA ligase (ADP-forming)